MVNVKGKAKEGGEEEDQDGSSRLEKMSHRRKNMRRNWGQGGGGWAVGEQR